MPLFSCIGREHNYNANNYHDYGNDEDEEEDDDDASSIYHMPDRISQTSLKSTTIPAQDTSFFHLNLVQYLISTSLLIPLPCPWQFILTTAAR